MIATPTIVAGILVALAGTALALAGFGMTAHMAGHMAAVAIAAPLVALGLPRRTPIGPLAAGVIELVLVWSWHLPAARALADANLVAALVEQAMFLGAGILLWRAALAQPALGVPALLLTSMHMTLLGALIGLATRPLYPMMAMHAAMRGVDPVGDQQLGGVVMLVIGGASYLAGGLMLLAALLREPRAA